MEGYLVEYELPSDVNYRIYHPGTKEFRVSRDVFFDEREFFNSRHVAGYSEEILPSAEIRAEENADHESDSEEVEQQNENAAPIIYHEIVVQPHPN